MEGQMAKTSLSDMQRVILSNAAMRMDYRVLPVPKSLQKGAGAVALSIRPMIAKGLVAEVPAQREDAVWREDEATGRIALVVTDAGLTAIGVPTDEESGGMQPASRRGEGPADLMQPLPVAQNPDTAPAKGMPRAGSKLAQLVETLSQPAGVTIPDIMQATGWQAHSVRGAMSGALKKKLGLTIVSEVEGDRGRVYRIAPWEPKAGGPSMGADENALSIIEPAASGSDPALFGYEAE
jgi:hypothetical protein